MQWSDIQFSPSPKTLRQFAGLWIVCFGGLALWQWLGRGHGTAAAILGVVALTVGPVGLLRPEWLRPLYVGWMVLAFPIGWTISQLILGVIYALVFTPIGLVFRLIGRDPLHRTRRPGVETYWTAKPVAASARRYFQQF
jgi:hypothetical protein